MRGNLTKAREETGADAPRFGGGGSWVDIGAMVAKETVFAITAIEWDGENSYNGKPRPRWVLDILPWYKDDSLPGKADDRGRLTQLDAGKLGLASHASRDPLMNRIADDFEANSDEIVDGVYDSPAVLVKVRVPGSGGQRYIDLCEWDEVNECPIIGPGTEVASDEDDEPRRPTGRQAPTRGSRQAPARQRPEPEPRDKETESAPPSPRPPARRPARSSGDSSPRSGERARATENASNSGFADADRARGLDDPAIVPSSAGITISDADLYLVANVVGGDAYTVPELATEYVLEEGVPFPGVKQWLTDHGISDFPAGRGRVRNDLKQAYEVALRAWMEHTGRTAQGGPAAEAEYIPGGPDHQAGYNSGANALSRERTLRAPELPTNAHAADTVMHPAAQGKVGGDQQPSRSEQRQAWMPPDEQERGGKSASEYVYTPGDVGDSIDPCPDCKVVVTGRAHPSPGGEYGIVHSCPTSGATIPLRATNIRKG